MDTQLNIRLRVFCLATAVAALTAVACEYPVAQLKKWIDDGEEGVAELARLRDVEYVDLNSGHWPQVSRPEDLAAVIVTAVDRT